MNESRADRYSFLATLVEAGGENSVGELERLLADERVYWNNLGMNLDDERKIDRPRVQFLGEILHHLGKFTYRDEQGLVRAVRDQFRDHPLLGRSTPSPIVEAADAILARP